MPDDNVSEKEKTPNGDMPGEVPQETDAEMTSIQGETHIVETYMVVPPDGGWGWVVAAASFFCNFIVDGIIFSFGMFLTDISEAFNESKPKVSLIGSLLAGFYLIVGPFVSALANRYGFRTVTILGSIIGCVAFIISYFANNLIYLIISYGVLGGIGFGLIYVPAVITVGFYFERWRALATGIAVCGSGIGTFLMAPLNTVLIKSFGWRGALLIQAGFVLHCIIFGAMFRPLKPVKIAVTENKEKYQPKEGEEQLPLLMRIKMEREQEMRKCDSMASFSSKVSVNAEKSGSGRKRLMSGNNNMLYPTMAQSFAGSTVTLSEKKQSCQSLNLVGAVVSGSKRQKRLSVASYKEEDRGPTSSVTADNISQKTNPLITDLEPLKEVNNVNNSRSDMNKLNAINTSRTRVRNRTPSESSRGSRRGTNAGIRPFYRDDIFYSSSLLRLPQYTSQNDSVGYHMSVSRLPTKQDIEEEEGKKCKLLPEAVVRTLSTMLDMSLIHSPSFILIALSGFVTMLGFYAPFVYVADRAKLGGIDPDLAVWLVSAIGIGNTVGRVVCGIISSIPGINALLINNIALTICGASTILSSVSLSVGYQFFYASVFGLSVACFASLRSVLLVDLLGLDKLTNAFGLALLFQGVAIVIGAPLAGYFMDVTGSYDASFYISGSMILVSAIMCYPLNIINRWEKKRNKELEGVAV